MWAVFSLFLGFLLEFWYLGLVERLVGPSAAMGLRRQIYRRQAVRFRDRAIALGGLLIKLGQFLSARVDLLPQEYTDVLATLQDAVPGAPWPAVAEILEDIGPWREMFAKVEEEPVAAASFGQVHRAWLPDGTMIALKVQRPGIRELVETDLRAVAWFLLVLERFTNIGHNIDLWSVYQEFADTSLAELDYAREAENARTFRANLANLPGVRVPRIYPEYSRGRVLALEFVEGIKVTDHAALEAAGLSRPAIARQLVEAYMQMVLQDGFFHADPHPGNLLVDDQGRLVLLDFGMVGRITPQQMQELRRLFVAIAQRREGEIVSAFDRLGFLRPTADRAAVRRAVGQLLDRFYGATVEEIYRIDPGALAAQLQELLRRQPFQVPANVAFLGRALSILVGVSTGLDPNLNLVRLFEPYARRLVLEGGETSLWREIQARLRRIGLSLLDLPELLVRHLEEERGASGPQGLAHAVEMEAAALRGLTRALYTMAFLGIAVASWLGHGPALAAVSAFAALVAYVAGGRRR